MMSLIYGQVPWTGLGVAFSFGIYGLLKARVAHDVSPIVSLSLETFILAPFGIAALFILNAQGQMTLFSEGPGHFWLLASTGVVTVVPLMLFAAATKALPLSIIGMVQYLGPTIQFVLALTVLHEQMSADRCWVWASSGLRSSSSPWMRCAPPAPTAPPRCPTRKPA